jgi:hypothetical protein
MKAHKRTLTREEWQVGLSEMYPEVYRTVAKDISKQLMAKVLYTLRTCYGFGEKRLKQFKENVDYMDSLKVFGKQYDNDDIIAELKEKYHIDLNDIKIEVEEK